MKNKYDEKKWNKARKRIFEITEVGYHLDNISCLYDMVNVFTILLNLTASILYTYDGVRTQYGSLLLAVETVTAVFFAVDYILRVISVRYKYGDKNMSEGKAIRNYVFSFMGITLSVSSYITVNRRERIEHEITFPCTNDYGGQKYDFVQTFVPYFTRKRNHIGSTSQRQSYQYNNTG